MLGTAVGAGVGEEVGTIVGAGVGDGVGAIVGARDGDGVGITGEGVVKYLSQLASPAKAVVWPWRLMAVVVDLARQPLPENETHNLEMSVELSFGT